VRNLDEFLVKRSHTGGYLRAGDYVTGWTGPSVSLDAATRTRLSEYLAHVSRQRRHGSPDWYLLDMAHVVAVGLGEFLDALDEVRRPWFARADQWRALLDGS
jgi:hypothetical protein